MRVRKSISLGSAAVLEGVSHEDFGDLNKGGEYFVYIKIVLLILLI